MGSESFIPKFEGTKSSGDMNIIVRPSNLMLDDVDQLASRTIAIRPKSARQARGGESFVTRMFACQTSDIRTNAKHSSTNPFEVTVCETSSMEVLQTLGCPV